MAHDPTLAEMLGVTCDTPGCRNVVTEDSYLCADHQERIAQQDSMRCPHVWRHQRCEHDAGHTGKHYWRGMTW